jgi:hypothetical protein
MLNKYNTCTFLLETIQENEPCITSCEDQRTTVVHKVFFFVFQ